ncbi:hypothetical protein [Streptomyces sp. AB3(2024)]|uniref:hypothetical protein n=1 Tax=Streptomyces sp. AB3(2024) TaxID=3317321 RepID=UPI0035A26AAA
MRGVARQGHYCFAGRTDLFQAPADERGGGIDPRPLGEAVAAAVDGLAAIRSLRADVDAESVFRTLILTLAAGA